MTRHATTATMAPPCLDGTVDRRAEDARLCSRLRRREPSCNEVRAVGGVLHLKRNSGEVVALKAR